MTLSGSAHAAPPAARSSGRQLDLLVRQLAAIDAWNSERRERRRTAASVAAGRMPREARMDLDRSVATLERTHEAVVGWTSELLARDTGALRAGLPPRAVLAHRHPWFVGALETALHERGVLVVATTDNGADALGAVIAEQPDLLLVEDALPLLSGVELLAQAALFAPATLLAAQVPDGDRVAAMLEAGAVSVSTRQVPPADVAEQLAQALAQRARPVVIDLT